MDPSVLDGIIHRLSNHPISEEDQLSESEVRQLCVVSCDIFLKQPTLLELKPPIKIVGDIHGQFCDLLILFDCVGYPPKSSYLFMGNYVDYGEQSLETMCLLLAYKIKYPENLFLLRGNHECASISRIYGFYDECKRKFNARMWNVFIDCFNRLPLAALIDDTIFCVHGGLSPDLIKLDQIRNIKRPVEVPDSGLICDLLWSDPSPEVQGWGMNDRGVSYTFGPDIVAEFLKKHDLDLICRSHQVVEDGYAFFADKQLVTIFSAPNYRGEYCNAGGFVSVDEKFLCSFKSIQPRFEMRILSSRSLTSTTQSGNSSGVNLFNNSTTNRVAYVSSKMKVADSTSKPNPGSTSATTTFGFDPNSLHRSKSKSPGVKRFLGTLYCVPCLLWCQKCKEKRNEAF